AAQGAEREIRQSPTVCIDTEYDSFRYFREKLCLIQIKARYKTYLFDPFGDADFSFLGDVFADPAYLKIIHAGDNDVRILRRDYGFDFVNVFDTHRAASLLGCQYLALATLVNQYLSIDFEKSKKMQRSRWDSRPLTDEQIAYAVADTTYLPALYRTLKKEIKRSGLEEQARQAFEGVTRAKWQEKVFDPHGYRRIAGYDGLNSRQRKRLKELHAWRFTKAKKIDRAVFMVLSDQEMIHLVKSVSKTPEEMIKAGTLTAEKAKHFGAELAAVLGRN
ncbi:MAG: ribonuclease D, partial [Smithellaceae bacterium]|nr:ribonuclease D [Smithellaceae bacterium]